MARRNRKAKLYLTANREALGEYERLCATLDCEYKKKPSVVFSRGDRNLLEKEVRILEIIGCPAELVSDLPLPISTVGAVKIENLMLLRNIELYTNKDTFLHK